MSSCSQIASRDTLSQSLFVVGPKQHPKTDFPGKVCEQQPRWMEQRRRERIWRQGAEQAEVSRTLGPRRRFGRGLIASWVAPSDGYTGNAVGEQTGEVDVFDFLCSKVFAFEQSCCDSLDLLPGQCICHELLGTDAK